MDSNTSQSGWPQSPSSSPIDSGRTWDDSTLGLVYSVSRRVARGFSAGNEQTAEDLTQECVIRTISVASQSNEWPPSPAWVSRVATNCCIDHMRLEDRAKHIDTSVDLADLQEVPDTRPLPEERMYARRCRVALDTALESLPATERDAVQLVVVMGLSYREAAAEMDVCSSTVGRKVKRGLLKLRRLIEKPAGISSDAMNGGHQSVPSAGPRPLVAYQEDPELILALERALRGVASCLLSGLKTVSSWREAGECVALYPGCPVVVDPGIRSDTGTGLDALRRLLRAYPDCPLIVFGRGEDGWWQDGQGESPDVPVVLFKGVSDEPEPLSDEIVRTIDWRETENLISRVKKGTPAGSHPLLDLILRHAVLRVTAVAIAGCMGISHQAMARQCKKLGLPTPKRLLDLATVYHVERLAGWSEHPSRSIARGIGFRRYSDYRRVTRRAVGKTPSQVREAGGPDYMADVILRRICRTN